MSTQNRQAVKKGAALCKNGQHEKVVKYWWWPRSEWPYVSYA